MLAPRIHTFWQQMSTPRAKGQARKAIFITTFVAIQARPDRFSTAIFDLTIIPNGKVRYPNSDFGNLSGLGLHDQAE
jgi:hypothetical protein